MYWLTFVSFVSADFDIYSDTRIFFGGFTAPKIRRRIRLSDFFSADIRRTKIRRLIQIFGGGLGVYVRASTAVCLARREALKTSGDAGETCWMLWRRATWCGQARYLGSIPLQQKVNYPIMHLRHNSLSVVRQYIETVTGQLADTPTRGLDISRTRQLAH